MSGECRKCGRPNPPVTPRCTGNCEKWGRLTGPFTREPAHIDMVLRLVRNEWSRNPDMRFAQFIWQACQRGGWNDPDIFYCEDGTVMRGLRWDRKETR